MSCDGAPNMAALIVIDPRLARRDAKSLAQLFADSLNALLGLQWHLLTLWHVGLYGLANLGHEVVSVKFWAQWNGFPLCEE